MKIEIKDENNFEDESKNTVDNFKRSKHITVGKDYNFIPKNIFFKIASFLLYCIAYPILFLYDKLVFGLKIKGRKNLRKIKGAKITISNHINILDVSFVSLANFPNPLYFPTIKSNLEIPFVSILVKLLRGLPIPNTFEGKRAFYNVIEDLLKRNKSIHFYPEGSLIPYHDKIRKFKDGAFDFACSYHVPVIPIVYTYREPKGIFKYIKKKKCITLNVLEAVYPEKDDKKYVEEFKNMVYHKMNTFMDENNYKS
ncbi:MAG: lysophospholipid acyltransferase family protein [Clostridia bacterium]|nr:lysophospholipid acyltransferase family protein [Clostridia bacterium]